MLCHSSDQNSYSFLAVGRRHHCPASFNAVNGGGEMQNSSNLAKLNNSKWLNVQKNSWTSPSHWRGIACSTVAQTHIWLMIRHMFVLVVKQTRSFCRKMCSCMWVYEVHAGQRWAELLVTPEIKIMKNQHSGGFDLRLDPGATKWGSLLQLLQRAASVSSLVAGRLYFISPVRAGLILICFLPVFGPAWLTRQEETQQRG